MRKTSQSGFTLIEMASVVAVIAVLAAVAIPQFMSEEREATADAEVSAMFSALAIAEQEYKLENGVYLSTGANEGATWPAVPGTTQQALAPYPAAWTTLNPNWPSISRVSAATSESSSTSRTWRPIPSLQGRGAL